MGIELVIFFVLLIIGGFIWVGYMAKKKKSEKGGSDPDQGKPGGGEST